MEIGSGGRMGVELSLQCARVLGMGWERPQGVYGDHSENMAPEPLLVSRQDSQRRDPPTKPLTQDVSCLQDMQGLGWSRDGGNDWPRLSPIPWQEPTPEAVNDTLLYFQAGAWHNYPL